MNNNPTPPLLQLKAICKTFRDGDRGIEVLHEINLEINPNEQLAIIGASGSGKSTLLHIMGLLDLPCTGQYLFEGQEMTNISEHKKRYFRNRLLGFVFQHFHLLRELSVFENVLMPARLAGSYSATRSYAEELLVNMGLKDRMWAKPNKLSGGEQQRAAIARALINRPKLLLCDEPTGNLDNQTANAIMEILFNLQSIQETTLVIVTHNLDLAKKAKHQLILRNSCLC